LVTKDKISSSDDNKVEIIERIHLLNLMGENNPKGVQKPSYNDHLSTNGACVGMLI
jgi:hypothetical protein